MVGLYTRVLRAGQQTNKKIILYCGGIGGRYSVGPLTIGTNKKINCKNNKILIIITFLGVFRYMSCKEDNRIAFIGLIRACMLGMT